MIGLLTYYIRIGKLLGRYLASQTDDAEKEELRRWFHGQKNASRLIANILDAKQVEKRRELYGQCDKEDAWRRIQARISLNIKSRRPSPRIVTARIAAAAILVAVLITAGKSVHDRLEWRHTMEQIAQIRPDGYVARLYLQDGTTIGLGKEYAGEMIEGANIRESSLEYSGKNIRTQDTYNVLVTPRGCEYKLTLCDGSRVWLNADSRLRYFVSNKGRERRVFLEGEAYFEVAPDAGRPFIVESGDQKIKVLGTRFNINTYGGSEAILTTLVEGAVSIVTPKNENPVQLHPGQQAVYSRQEHDSIRVDAVDASQYTVWTTGTFIFDRASIAQIMKDLSRWYNFEYEISPQLADLRFSGQFPRYENLDKVLTIITSTGNDIKIDYDGEKIILK